MRLHRLNTGRGGFDDLVELIRHLTGCREYDQAVSFAFEACDLIGGEVAISALLAESVPLIPTDHSGYLPLADRECEALLRIGPVSATVERRNPLLKLAESRAAADPGNAGYQRGRSQPVEAIALVKRALRSVRGRSSHVKGAYGAASDGAARHP